MSESRTGKPTDWRPVEIAAIDALRRQACPLDYQHGVTSILFEFRDDATGELLVRQRVVDIERFARDLAEAL